MFSFASSAVVYLTGDSATTNEKSWKRKKTQSAEAMGNSFASEIWKNFVCRTLMNSIHALEINKLIRLILLFIQS